MEAVDQDRIVIDNYKYLQKHVEVVETVLSSNNATFIVPNEDHTLANSLRFLIMKNPKVEFCGYSIPHPSESCFHLRIQTYHGSAKEVLIETLDQLIGLCNNISEKFRQIN